MSEIILADSITTLPKRHRGLTVVCGSHGGSYPAAIAIHAGLGSVIFNDAGGGLDNAGFASLSICDAAGMPASTVDTMSCRIGDAGDMMDRGRISHANKLAQALGIERGITVATASSFLAKAKERPMCDPKHATAVEEARRERHVEEIRIVLADSASLVSSNDDGAIVITGSHGGLIGGDPARALKANAYFAVFNDAGRGIDNCGIQRLPALDQRSVAAACVAASSARIGDAGSTLDDGIVSAVNKSAQAMGIKVGQSAAKAVDLALKQKSR